MVVTEGRPDETGLVMARELHELGVPVIAILDSAVAFALERLRCAWLLVGVAHACAYCNMHACVCCPGSSAPSHGPNRSSGVRCSPGGSCDPSGQPDSP